MVKVPFHLSSVVYSPCIFGLVLQFNAQVMARVNLSFCLHLYTFCPCFICQKRPIDTFSLLPGSPGQVGSKKTQESFKIYSHLKHAVLIHT